MINPDGKSQKVKSILELFNQLKDLESRVSVMEECTATWDCRLEDLENWQTQVDDRLEGVDKRQNDFEDLMRG